MAKIENRKKQNPTLMQSELSDGRASLYLEYYLGRTETPVLDENGKIYFRMFKRMVTAAVDKDLIKKNPCRGFVLKNDNMTLQKYCSLRNSRNSWRHIMKER